jgi:hypothetical protein
MHGILKNIILIYFNLINTCKFYHSRLDNLNFWKTIMILIYPYNYSITSNSIHINTKSFRECRNFFRNLEGYTKNNWINDGKPCRHIHHYDINTLKCISTYDEKKSFNYKKLILKKLRTFLNNGSVEEYKDLSSNITKYICNIKNIDKRIIMIEKQLIYLHKQKQLREKKEILLTRLNYSIDNCKTRKYNSYINFIKKQKTLSNYIFSDAKQLWKSMSKIEKQQYKTINI